MEEKNLACAPMLERGRYPYTQIVNLSQMSEPQISDFMRDHGAGAWAWLLSSTGSEQIIGFAEESDAIGFAQAYDSRAIRLEVMKTVVMASTRRISARWTMEVAQDCVSEVDPSVYEEIEKELVRGSLHL